MTGPRDDDPACVGCGEPVHVGDRYFPDVSGVLCVGCSPTYEQLLDEPEGFVETTDEEPRTPEECRAEYDAHIAAGGAPSDTMATRIWK